MLQQGPLVKKLPGKYGKLAHGLTLCVHVQQARVVVDHKVKIGQSGLWPIVEDVCVRAVINHVIRRVGDAGVIRRTVLV